MFFTDFPGFCYHAQSHRPFHTATAYSKCHLSWAFVIFLQDLDACLSYKASSGYLMSFVLDIFNEKR